MKNYLTLLLMMLACITPVVRIGLSVQFNQKCEGYLKQAADANTVEIALDRINLALDYIERNNLTDGYTSILWNTEDENIGFWYKNIKACKSELEACLTGTQLEKSNVLMKVRESLTDNGEHGTRMTVPDGISAYPHNVLFFILNTISIIVLIFGFIILTDDL